MKAIIVGAMHQEVAPFVRAADRQQDGIEWRTDSSLFEDKTGAFSELFYRDQRIRVLQSGVGLVNAASVLTETLLQVHADIVINVGTAGSLSESVLVGSVVIPTNFGYLSADAREFGYALGQVPGQPEVFVSDLSTQVALVDIAREKIGPQVVISQGNALSGDTFVASQRHPALAPWIEQSDGLIIDTVDMETAAYAQVCRARGVKFASVRVVTDSVFEESLSAEDHTSRLACASSLASDIAYQFITRGFDSER